ncbi:MAG: DNA polymerase III subunit delta' [Thermotaleaceae bacterium]
MGFHEIIGQEKIIKNLVMEIQKDKIGHAYIFDGPEGLGKGMMATAFAQAILCKSFQQDACDICSACRKVYHHNHPDMMIIEPEGASIKNKQIEEFQQDLLLKPYESTKKIYILKNADQMTISAQNRLLKTLEEPPEYGVIILISTNINRFLPTIRSRCQVIKFNRNGEEGILSFLQKRYQLEREEAKILAAFSDGIIGRAIQLKESSAFLEKREATIEMMDKILNRNPLDVFSVMDFFEKYKEDIYEILDLMLVWFRDILVLKETQNENFLMNLDKKRILREHGYRIGYPQISHIISIIEKSKQDMKANVNFQLIIENMLLNIQEV